MLLRTSRARPGGAGYGEQVRSGCEASTKGARSSASEQGVRRRPQSCRKRAGALVFARHTQFLCCLGSPSIVFHKPRWPLARGMASCHDEGAEWCGGGRCVGVELAGHKTGEWRCMCNSGWRSSYLSIEPSESEQPRCEIVTSVMHAFLLFMVICSALLLALQLQAIRSGHLGKCRGFLCAFASTVNFSIGVVGLMIPADEQLSPTASKLFFPVVSLGVIIYGVVAIAITIDKYLKVVRATAQGIMIGKDTRRNKVRSKLSPETLVVIVGCLAAWMACSIVWLTLLRNARACWALLFVLVGFSIATATLSSHRTISALDHELRKSEFEHQQRTKVLTNTLLMSSNIAMSNKLRRLRCKLARTHRSIIIPGFVTILMVFLFLGLVATAESTQRLDYSVQAWYVVYLGTLYGLISHRRAQRRARVSDSDISSFHAKPAPGSVALTQPSSVAT